MPLFLFIISIFSIAQPPDYQWVTPQKHDFGDLRKGQNATHVFELKNTSATDPLLIDIVRTTCSCTATDYPETPILPGETARIIIEYDTSKSGYFIKPIKVFIHGQRKGEKLEIRGEVI